MTTDVSSSEAEALHLEPAGKRAGLKFPPVGALIVSIGLALGILAVEIFTPRGITVAALYVIPIIVVQRAASIVYTMLASVLCAGLASLGIILSPDIGVPSHVVLADYAIVLVTLTATATIGIITSRRAAQLQTVSKLLTMCAWTKKVKVQGEWIPVEDYLTKHVGLTISHGMTEDSAREFLADAGIEVEEKE
jgi:hypothetical protein